MRRILSPVLLRALSLLLPLATCGWALNFPKFANSDDPVHIYTSNDWRYFHLQIHPDGRVDSTQPETVYSAVLIKPVSAEDVVITGANTKFHLCMLSNGSLYGSPSFSNEDCVFKHTLLENRHDIYESRKHKFLVSLGTVKGRLRPNRNMPPFSQFLSRENRIPLSEIYPPRPQPEDTSYTYFKPCENILPGSRENDSPGEADDDICFP